VGREKTSALFTKNSLSIVFGCVSRFWRRKKPPEARFLSAQTNGGIVFWEKEKKIGSISFLHVYS
jgi:hypothetical protein